MKHPLACLAILAAAPMAFAQTIPLPNPSFEEGDNAPAGWTLSGGKGEWLADGAPDGNRAVAVTGTGKDSNFWRSGTLPMKPGTVYGLRFKARCDGVGGGTPVTGPSFCNRDLGKIPAEWADYESVFVTPPNLTPDQSWIRFGQWQVNGTVAFDQIELVEATPVHRWRGLLALGEGERLSGQEYFFDAPLGSACGNHSRAWSGHTCGFNSNRWTFAAGQGTAYRHQVHERHQTAAEVTVSVTWYQAGELVVDASEDGESWHTLGTIGKKGSATFPLPARMLPAKEVYVRMTARPVRAKPNGGASLQVSGYTYRATLDGEPEVHVGRTRYFAVSERDPRFNVTIVDVGDALPNDLGEYNRVTLWVENRTGGEVRATPQVTVRPFGKGAFKSRDTDTLLKPGQQLLQLPYFVMTTGDVTLVVELGDLRGPSLTTTEDTVVYDSGGITGFRATGRLRVPNLHNADYGEVLPGSSDAVGLWWASSGWKISQRRGPPTDEAKAVHIRAAGNEAEAAQIVVRPDKGLKGLTAKADVLKGPGGAVIPAEAIDILRVRYVMVTRPTDSTGCVAPWPDPLPPLRGPIDLEAMKNQPLWVRVTVPKDAKAGTYKGTVHLKAEGWAADVPLEVEVFDFALPGRMTCKTAFGFSPGNVWRYQKVTRPEDRRAVLEKYWANFASHHISPYDPAPMDRLKVTWPKGENGKHTLVPQFDWTAWDAAMQRAIDQRHFNSFRLSIPGMGGGTFHARREPSLLGYSEDSPEYKTAFTNYCRALEAHLKEKGWLPYAFVYWFDEPAPRDYAFVMNGFRKLKEACPAITRMLTEQVEPALAGGPNLWCPVSPNYHHERAEERRARGERFWWYVCCGPKAPYCTLFIDHPATELRVWLWQTWQRKINGILVWQTNYWTSTAAYPDANRPQNPYEDPMGWTSGYSTPKGVKRPWGNGDGRFIYPPEAAADAHPKAPVLDGPVDSIRWEMLRDGLEDYEYLAILRRLLREKGGRLDASKRAEFAALLEVPEEITKDMTTFTKDPAPIERRRLAIARAIAQLSRL